MGASRDAWIEYDDSPYRATRANEEGGERASAVCSAFSQPHDNCIPLTDWVGFRSGKDYRFFAAISGVRAEVDDPHPLYPLRGGPPPNLSGYAERLIDEVCDVNDAGIGWLSLPEIEDALAHFGLAREQLSEAVNIVLDLMAMLERRYGPGRSRLIFLIDG